MKAFIVFLMVLYFFFPSKVFAQSDYVLPYPSAMPGSIWYKLHLVQEELERYWHFGNFAQFHYHLKQADKYLVEAKTLFEYKQYLLASKSLQRSDIHFQRAEPFLQKAAGEGKIITEKEALFKSASLKHQEVLVGIETIVPEEFAWTPEKKPQTVLNLKKSILQSIQIRTL